MKARTSIEEILRTQQGKSIAISAGLLSIALLVSVSSLARIGKSVSRFAHTYQMVAEINAAVAALRDSEIDERAYVVTGEERFFESFRSRAEIARNAFARLPGLAWDNDQRKARLRRVEELAYVRLEELSELAALRRREGIEAASDVLASDAAHVATSAMRGAVAEAIEKELGLLESRRRAMDKDLLTSTLTILLCGGLALVLSIHAFILMRRAINALRREAELIGQKETAERVANERTEFLANMSHEIRTPLNSVLGFAELLRGISTTGKQGQYIDAIRMSGNILLGLIDDILDLAKIEAGRLEVSLEPVSISILFARLRTIFGAQAEERGLTLTFDLGESIPPALMLDPVRLRQMLFNTVGNALKFTRQGGVIVSARAEMADDETAVSLTFSVVDTGVGIEAEDQGIIFEPFRQARDRASRVAGGTGLGLSITRRLARILGGDVSLQSTPGQGSTFSFQFPRVPISAALPDASDRPDGDEDFNQFRPSLILIVDDVPLNRELIAAILEPSHHRVLQAGSGKDAVETARIRQPDLILMDLRMPDLSGRDAFEILRASRETSAIPVVAVTASVLREVEIEIQRVFDGFLRKPFTRAALHRELARHLPRDDGTGVARERDEASTALPSAPQGAEDLAQASWAGLVTRLRQIEAEYWPTLRRSMGFREMGAFGRRLAGMADETECGPLRRFADKLLKEVANFEIEEQERTLQEFPQIVAAIARRADSFEPQ